MDAGLDDLLASPEFITDPYPIFRRLREESPVHWVEPWGCWLLTRAEDIELTIRDTRRFSSARPGDPGHRADAGLGDGPARRAPRELRGRDGPDRPARTTPASAAWSARRSRRAASRDLRERIQELVDGYLDPVLPTGRIELVADLAHPLPAVVIAEMSGFPGRGPRTIPRLDVPDQLVLLPVRDGGSRGGGGRRRGGRRGPRLDPRPARRAASPAHGRPAERARRRGVRRWPADRGRAPEHGDHAVPRRPRHHDAAHRARHERARPAARTSWPCCASGPTSSRRRSRRCCATTPRSR